MSNGLKELEIDLQKTDVFVTHMHADHSGLVSTIAAEGARVYCRHPDTDTINSKASWDPVLEFAVNNGFPDDKEAIKLHPGFKYRNRETVDFSVISDGDEIQIGDYTLICIATPGHSQGHTCLYEPNKKLLFSGDHILFKITPNIALFSDNHNPLQEYLLSLDKVYKMDVDLVLPAHRWLSKDLRKRVDELKKHHQHRCENILAVLVQGSHNAYQIASKIEWDLSYDNWEEVHISQKWFATGEVIAHLKYLQELNQVKYFEHGEIRYFELS
jgi:glyoxylase-like metal-dependent hydrolase (beta-lactamase superfamily II)